jgi:WD40 repeat protein
MNGRLLLILVALALSAGIAGVSWAVGEDPLDPVHNTALPCESLSTPGLVPRAAKNVTHVANVCGFVGTDMEFQSRTDASGNVHDYAFVGSMGGGTRIFDVTDPARPFIAGQYTDPGYQNDVAVAGDLLVLGFDSLGVSGATSACLHQKSTAQNGATRGGIDIVRLVYDRQTATFDTQLIDCYLSTLPGDGAHTVTIHPSGDWISVNTSADGLEVVDFRSGTARFVQHLGNAVVDDAHDVSFSRDGNTLYSAGLSSTRVVDVTGVVDGAAPRVLATLPNAPSTAQGGDGQTIQLSHQSDTTSDGKLLLVTDEAGGGITETGCNQGPSGKIGGAHVWSLADLAAPRKLGTWMYPNPVLAPDPLAPVLAAIGRTERACTIHVFRFGGNGSSGPGAVVPGFDGVSRLGPREIATAHYGAGVWHVDISAAASSTDGIAEDPRTTWGNTRGWNVMPGAETWSAKEYKGYVYAGDMGRGFDVYRFGASCDGIGCIASPVSTPGRAKGGGKAPGELAELSILSGTNAGGKANFSLDVTFVAGAPAPSGSISFNDHEGTQVQSAAIDTLTVTGTKATIAARGTVNGRPGVRLVVEVEDLGEPGRADTFRLVTGDGYGAGGVLLNGNIDVTGGIL